MSTIIEVILVLLNSHDVSTAIADSAAAIGAAVKLSTAEAQTWRGVLLKRKMPTSEAPMVIIERNAITGDLFRVAGLKGLASTAF